MDEAVRNTTLCNEDPNISLNGGECLNRPSWSHGTRSRLCTVLGIREKSVLLLILSAYLSVVIPMSIYYVTGMVSLT